jgi:hypothetical protein
MGCAKNARPTTLTTVMQAMATNTAPPMAALASQLRANQRYPLSFELSPFGILSPVYAPKLAFLTFVNEQARTL